MGTVVRYLDKITGRYVSLPTIKGERGDKSIVIFLSPDESGGKLSDEELRYVVENTCDVKLVAPAYNDMVCSISSMHLKTYKYSVHELDDEDNLIILEVLVNLSDGSYTYKYKLFKSGGGELPYYEGEYEKTPRVYSQTLETEQHSMHKDVVVKEIPKTEISNPFGGLTVEIG